MKSEKLAHTIVLRPLANQLLWLEVKRHNGSTSVVSGGSIAFDMQEDDSAQDTLHRALQELKSKIEINWFAGCEIILTAPGNIYTARYTQVPPADEETIREAAAFEVAETLQIPIEEIAWDLHQSSHQGNSHEVSLIWAAARKPSIASLLSTLPKQVLFPTQVTPDFWAVYETLLNRNADLLKEPALVCYYDGSHLSVFAADQQAVYFTRSVGSGGDAQHLSHTLQTEIQRLIQYVPERFETGEIQTVLCCGLNHLPLEELRGMAETHSLQCIQINNQDMESVLPIPSGSDLQPAHFPLLCTAYATMILGQPGINLLAEDQGTSWWEHLTSEEALPPKPVLKRIAMMAGAVVVLWISQVLWFHYAAASYLEEGEDLLRVANYLGDEEKALRSMLRTHVNYDDLFVFLSETLPNEVLVKSLSIDTKSGVDMVLTGGNSQMTKEFVEALNRSKFFKDMVESRAAMESSGFTVYVQGKLRV